jgi:hypothetical protein
MKGKENPARGKTTEIPDVFRKKNEELNSFWPLVNSS